MKNHLFYIIITVLFTSGLMAVNQPLVFFDKGKNNIAIAGNTLSTSILTDDQTDAAIVTAAQILSSDLHQVTEGQISLCHSKEKLQKHDRLIIAGSISDNLVQDIIKKKEIDISPISKHKEAYLIIYVKNALPSTQHCMLIIGSDPRGTVYGMMDFTRSCGVSPWEWWADIPVTKHKDIYISTKNVITDYPRVEYRGIFINDEAPALSNWSKEKFGGFNHKFYAKVFELLVRLKANYIWPAMWGNAFFDDDPQNQIMATKYGIVIATSHHEPMMRAHAEWAKYYKNQAWNYQKNEAVLQEFWKKGFERTTCEKVVTVGMRGDGDEPMSQSTAIDLLTKIVADQRKIIAESTGKPAEETPQVWALYKEVQDYFDKGMAVPEDITLLFCDDNWGNVRRLPKKNNNRKGGYGMYYHFDYVGGPRNYKWLNTNYIPRIWDQMNLTYLHNVNKIWIVNVGDIKPMELPISFFLDMAWNPENFDLQSPVQYFYRWSEEQFGKTNAQAISKILDASSRLISLKKPELIHARSFNYEKSEWDDLIKMYNLLEKTSEKQMASLDSSYHVAYYQLVHHPIEAMANLMRMYFHQAQNHHLYALKNFQANFHADKVKQYFNQDSIITEKYHKLKNGKWNHMMSQTHIGYTYWQQPEKQVQPHVYRLWNWECEQTHPILFENKTPLTKELVLQLKNAIQQNNDWQLIKNQSNFGDAICVNRAILSETKSGKFTFSVPVNTSDADTFSYLHLFFAPTLDIYHDGGLKISYSVDDGPANEISVNAKGVDNPGWQKWVADNTIHTVVPLTEKISGSRVIHFTDYSGALVWQGAYLSTHSHKNSYFGALRPDVNTFANQLHTEKPKKQLNGK